jgi:TPR repeat protein
MLAAIKGSAASRRSSVVREATHLAMTRQGLPKADGIDRLVNLRGPTEVDFDAREMSIEAVGATAPSVDLASQYRAGYEDSCAQALTAAFADTTGTQWVQFETPAGVANLQGVSRLHLSWLAQPNPEDRSRTTITIRAELFEPPPLYPSTYDPIATVAVDIPFEANVSSVGPRELVDFACARTGQLLVQQLAGLPLATIDPAPGEVEAKTKGCAAGDAGSCVDAANAYRDGTNVPRDSAKAAVLYSRGCEETTQSQATACEAAAAFALTQADADPANAPRHRDDAHRFLLSACSARSATACARLAALDTGAKAFGRRMEACDLGDVGSCALAARALARGDGVPKSFSAAEVVGAQACAAGARDVCGDVPGWKRAARSEVDVFGIKLHKGERVVDVRAGTWFEEAQTAVVWIASPAAADVVEKRFSYRESERVRVHDLERNDIVLEIDPEPSEDLELPDDTLTLYGVAPEPPNGAEFCQCERGGRSRRLGCHCREDSEFP